MVIFTRTPDTKIPLSSSEDIPLQKGGLQELWFLTISHPVTLSEVIDIVQLESRFRGTYIGVEIFNLDGGSSVGYVNHVYPSLNFGKSKKLPIVF